MEEDQPVETKEEYGEDPAGLVRRYLNEISLAEKEFTNGKRDWYETGDKIVERYRDERGTAENDKRQLNILWANVQLLQPALYSRTPKPVVVRRNKDKNKVNRAAAETLERVAETAVDIEEFDRTMRAVVQDALLPGRGTAWVRYEAEFKTVVPRIKVVVNEFGRYMTEDGDPVDVALVSEDMTIEGEPYEELVAERAVPDYVYWKDFLHNAARCPSEIRWVARRSYLTRDELVERFGEEIGSKVPLDYKPKHITDKEAFSTVEHEAYKKAMVWEIWNKEERKVCWISKEFKESPLDERDDPLGLQGFFPCPMPLMATTTTNTMVPVPDYVEYQDQAEEIDKLTSRINALTESLKVAGVYNGAHKENLARLVQEGENTLIPVEDWQSFQSGGGTRGAIEWLPTDQIAKTLIQLYDARDRIKQDLYEITGISDVLRGASNAQETYGAQNLKARYGSLRLSDRQGEVQRFARDLMRIMIEIAAEHFSPETLKEMSATDLPDRAEVQRAKELLAIAKQRGKDVPPELLGRVTNIAESPPFEDVIEFLRKDRMRLLRLDIETDSTIAMDLEEDKRSRIEFITAAGGFLNSAVQLSAAAPELKPLLGEMLMFGVRGFHQARPLEEAFEEVADQTKEQRKADMGQMQQQIDPTEAKRVEYDHQEAMAKIQVDAREDQMDAAAKAKDLELRERELAIKEREQAVNEAEALYGVAQDTDVAALQAEVQRLAQRIDGNA